MGQTVKQSEHLDNTTLMHLAQAAVMRYPANLQGQLRLLCQSENATYQLSAGAQRYALRLHRGDYHDRQTIESELLWLDALRDSGFQVPQARRDDEGERVLVLPLANGEERYAVLFDWIEGDMPTADMDPRAFRQLGAITARLHQHARQWQRPPAFKRIVWDHPSMVGAQGHWGDWRCLVGLDSSAAAIIEQAQANVAADLAAFGQQPAHYGLIHADLRLTNLLLHKGETQVIDFDDCGLGWYLHDLAAAISFVEHHPNAPAWVDYWLQGYEQVAHISDAEMARVPSLLIQRRIQLSAWVASHAQTETALQLREHWVPDTVRLCRAYLEGSPRPIGA
ncbi:TPA: phosphotransferase [Pseudomonas aeruginosa]|uniref:phosphotransferase enzyme family protein n=1 Tax=Pseudomonas aeruginosa TaxID=287 RepID=UPI001496139F|nr:phosphotransferase [Pseudomonas aeruginosa]ELM7154612.1 phosphotransferase [Pseudomonas aeruginosa]NPS71758.1 phosphotransferase [Pseudomonas aeruginosa]HEJ1394746.1 phosphotransferase [Pseudomonas aeruginosa]HEJ2075742.1 phosphotransferase [Pseudomonas aeruginosa]HEJ2283746.1 phosphotransferase [Pseudomonas aeruginosa]